MLYQLSYALLRSLAGVAASMRPVNRRKSNRQNATSAAKKTTEIKGADMALPTSHGTTGAPGSVAAAAANLMG